MARYRLSSPARTDIDEILGVSLERWGANGRDRYARLLMFAIRLVAQEPAVAGAQDRSALSAGLRSFHLRHVRGRARVMRPVHVVFFRASGTGSLEIVRVLHERMDPAQQGLVSIKRSGVR